MHPSAAADYPYEQAQPSGLAAWRIGIGLVQGLVLYLLYQAGENRAWPAGTPLPPSFLATNWASMDNVHLPDCLERPGVGCDAFLIDFDHDGKPEVLLVGDGKWAQSAVFSEAPGGQWRMQASLAAASLCKPMRQALREGKVRTVPSRLADLEIAGQRVAVEPFVDHKASCPADPAAQQDAARR